MVLYKCNKCFKDFTKKYNYELHINRKFPCNNNIDKDFLITELKEENTELKEENIELKEKNIELKEEINRLKLEKELEAKEIYKDVLEKYICTVSLVKADSSVSEGNSANKASNKKSNKKNYK
jgi:hypothetical protein